MKHKKKHEINVWTKLCEQLVVIIATVMIFCLLPDFSDSNHFESQSTKAKSFDEIQAGNIKKLKPKNKHIKKPSASDSANGNSINIVESNELLDSLDNGIHKDELAEPEVVSELSSDADVQQEPLPESAEKLNRVEKINAEIEVQAFVLTAQQEQDNLTDDVLDKIESNLLTIKKMAHKEGIDSLIDNPSIEEIGKKIALYRKTL